VGVAVLGVLNAGAAYVAIDQRYLRARQIQMADASGAAVVVSDQPGTWLAERCTAIVVGELVDHPAASVIGLAVWQECAACILFTSGSSGEPKGVVVESRRSEDPVLPARTATEEVMIEIWTALLETQDVRAGQRILRTRRKLSIGFSVGAGSIAGH